MVYEKNIILYVGKGGLPAALTELSGADAFHIEGLNDAGKAMETFSHGKCSLIILNDDLFGDEIFKYVRELKRRQQLTPLLVLSDSMDTTYQTNLMMAGADDFVPANAMKEELYYRVGFRLKQYRQSRDLALGKRHMYEITTLAKRLHSHVDPQILISETIDLASSTFKLYGMAVILMEDDMVCVYAGREGVSRHGNLYETKMYPQTYEPFHRVIQSGIAEVFENISDNANYVPIPILPEASSAIIIPLQYQEYNIGAICAFGSVESPVGLEDLALYEILTSQFAVALQNAHYNHNQSMNMQFSRTLRRAWQRFVTLQSPSDISNAMYEMIEELPGVQHSLVWLHDEDYWWMGKPIISAPDSDTIELIINLIKRGHIYELVERVDDGPQILSQLGLGQQNPFFPLFKSLKSHQLVILPISDSARLIGGVIASVANNREFNMDVVNLMKSLTHAAGQALERMTLIFATLEKSSRLEAILLSITEGIFFVDDNNQVAFCNPQFTELTNIAPSEVLYKDVDLLLDYLASQAEDYESILQQLQDAMESQRNPQIGTMTYPIVSINLANTRLRIQVEFNSTNNMSSSKKGWVGIVRDMSRFARGEVSAQIDGRETAPARIPATATVGEKKSAQASSSSVEKANDRATTPSAPSRQPHTVMMIEGQNELTRTLQEWFNGRGYDVMTYKSGDEAVRDINLTRVDLIVIDMNPAGTKGWKVCKYLRNQTETPILMVADTASPDVTKALNNGADDCISKPIEQEELTARINAIFKRQQIPDRMREPLSMGDLYIDFGRREVFVNKKPVELTRIEYDLLHSLVTHQRQVLTHQQILEKVWGPEYRSETQYLWVNICRLRKKLEPTSYIQNRQGVGYVFQDS